MGIEFALFGLGSQKADALLAKGKDEGSALLKFEVGGRAYEVERWLVRQNGSLKQDARRSYLKADGAKEALSPTDLKQRILEVLKFNEPLNPNAESRIFRYAVFTPQEEMKRILAESWGRNKARKDRLETIRKAFRIEDYKQAADNAIEIGRKMKARLKMLEERFFELERLKDMLKVEKTEITRLRFHIANESRRMERVEAKMGGIESELEELNVKNNDRIRIEAERDASRERANRCRVDIEEYKDDEIKSRARCDAIRRKIVELEGGGRPTESTMEELDGAIARYRDLENLESAARANSESLASRVAELETKLGEYSDADADELKSRAEHMREQLDELTVKLDATQKEITKISTERGRLSEQEKDSRGRLDKISSLGAKCPTCSGNITDERRRKLETDAQSRLEDVLVAIENVKQRLDEEAANERTIKEKIGVESDRLEDITRIIPELEELLRSRLNLQAATLKVRNVMEKRMANSKLSSDSSVESLLGLKSRLADYLRDQKTLKEKMDDLRGEEKVAKVAKQRRRKAEEEAQRYDSEAVAVQEKLKSFGDLAGSISRCKARLDVLRKELNQGKVKIAELGANLKNGEEKRDAYEERIAKAERWKVEHERLSAYHEWLNSYFVPAVEQIEKQVMLSIQQQFNETYRRWYSILIEDATKETRIDEDFTPIVEQDGFEQDVAFLSGGEKTGVALAYRLALNSLMRAETDSMNSNLLILDEPTDGFSKSQLHKMKDVLDELQSEQIIIVSHEEELETFADTVLDVAKEGGRSRIVKK